MGNIKKKILLFAMLAISTMSSFSQISVVSFEKLDNDMRARTAKVRDDNGDLCSLIILGTTEKGFEFDSDVVKTEQGTGEILVFVSPGKKFITVKHSQLGNLQNYEFPQTIESGSVYLMKLISAKVRTIIEDVQTENYLIIRTSTPNAKIFIDGEYVGTSTASKYLSIIKEHNYRVEAPLYHAKEGKVKLNSENKTELNIELIPAFGYLNVTSIPNNISVEVDGKIYTTPFKTSALASGTYTISAFKEMYKSYVSQVVVEDNKTTDVNINLEANFAEATITAKDNDAFIYIDGSYKSIGKWVGKLEAGVHKIEVKKDKHSSYIKTINVQGCKNITENIPTLDPICGKLNINSSPIGAEIKIDGKDYGATPNVISNLLIGKHDVVLSKQGYSTITAEINIEEGKIVDQNFTMIEGMYVNIKSDKEGSKLYVDGEYIGESPQTMRLSFGKHKIEAEYKGMKIEKEETVQDGGLQDINLEFTKTIKIISNKSSTIIYIDDKYWGYEPLYAKLPLGKYKIEAKYDGEVLMKNINVTPNSDTEINFKFRSKLFAVINVSTSFGAKDNLYGISMGQAWKYIGWYIGAKSNFNFEGYTSKTNNDNIFYTGKTSYTCFTPSMGLMFGKNKFYWKIGVTGNFVSNFWQLSDNTWVKNENKIFPEITTGLQYFGKRIVASLDVATSDILEYMELNLGIGYRF